MRTVTSLVLLALLSFVPACGKADAAVGDIAKQTAAIDKLKTTCTDLGKTLTGITDGASAEKAKAQLEGLVATLKTQVADCGTMGKLADNLGGAKDAAIKAAKDQIAKLSANADIQKAIGPVLDQLKTALGG